MGRSQTYSWFIVAGWRERSGSGSKGMERVLLEGWFHLAPVALLPCRCGLIRIMRLGWLPCFRSFWWSLSGLRGWGTAGRHDDKLRSCGALAQDQDNNDGDRDPKDCEDDAVNEGSSLHISSLRATIAHQLESGIGCRQPYNPFVQYNRYTIPRSSCRTSPEVGRGARNHIRRPPLADLKSSYCSLGRIRWLD